VGTRADAKSAERRVTINLLLSETATGFSLQLTDEDGVCASAQLDSEKILATQPDKVESTLRDNLGKLGNTIFAARDIEIRLTAPWFLPASSINAPRRAAITNSKRLCARHRRPPRKAASEPPAPAGGVAVVSGKYLHDAARQFYARQSS
jgi:putative protease